MTFANDFTIFSKTLSIKFQTVILRNIWSEKYKNDRDDNISKLSKMLLTFD